MRYLRHYYVTLCGDYFGKYVDLYAFDKEYALDGVIKVYGVMNVSKVYTDTAWQRKYKDVFTYAGFIESDEERRFKEDRKKKKYRFKGWK